LLCFGFADLPIHLQDLKHTISGAKNNMLKRLRKENADGDAGLFSSDLTSKEKKWLKHFLPNQGQRMGFRTFKLSPECTEAISLKLPVLEAQRQEECEAENRDYSHIDRFLIKEAFKLKLWNNLDANEKEHWRKVGELTLGQEELTEYVFSFGSSSFSTDNEAFSAERVQLTQKVLVRVCETLSSKIGMHIVMYTSYMMDGVPCSTS